MPDTHTKKDSLRNDLRALRRQLTIDDQRDTALGVSQSIEALPGWQQVEHLALYLPNDSEVDTSFIVDSARTQGKFLYLPVIMQDNHLEFALWRDQDALVENRYGIPEPPASAPRRSIEELDLVLVPLVAWDRQGNRLGMGGGFYDRSTGQTKETLLVGLAHACQEVDMLPRDDWDLRLDFVATRASLVRCQVSPEK